MIKKNKKTGNIFDSISKVPLTGFRNTGLLNTQTTKVNSEYYRARKLKKTMDNMKSERIVDSRRGLMDMSRGNSQTRYPCLICGTGTQSKDLVCQSCTGGKRYVKPFGDY